MTRRHDGVSSIRGERSEPRPASEERHGAKRRARRREREPRLTPTRATATLHRRDLRGAPRSHAPRLSRHPAWVRTSRSTAGRSRSPKASSRSSASARVRNTPIIESGALGAAMGLALEGLRPMVEMQFGDFITCGFNQIVNNLAKTHYRWGVGLPSRDSGAGGRRHRRRPVSLAESGGVVHPRGRPEGRGAGDAGRRQGPAAVGVRRRQPRAVSGAQVPLSIGQGTGARRRHPDAHRAGARGARGTRPDDRHLGRRRPLGARGGDDARCARGPRSR